MFRQYFRVCSTLGRRWQKKSAHEICFTIRHLGPRCLFTFDYDCFESYQYRVFFAEFFKNKICDICKPGWNIFCKPVVLRQSRRHIDKNRAWRHKFSSGLVCWGVDDETRRHFSRGASAVPKPSISKGAVPIRIPPKEKDRALFFPFLGRLEFIWEDRLQNVFFEDFQAQHDNIRSCRSFFVLNKTGETPN